MKTEKNFYYYTTLMLTLVVVIGVVFAFNGKKIVEAVYSPVPENLLEEAYGGDGTIISPLYSSCLDGYKLWQKSDKIKTNVKWASSFMVSYIHPKSTTNSTGTTPAETAKEYLMDLNGDGLVDYFYSAHGFGSKNIDCIYLHNGFNWEPVYRCVVKKVNYTDSPTEHIVYGDCADVENSGLVE